MYVEFTLINKMYSAVFCQSKVEVFKQPKLSLLSITKCEGDCSFVSNKFSWLNHRCNFFSYEVY